MASIMAVKGANAGCWTDSKLRKANHFDDISEVLGRMALEHSIDHAEGAGEGVYPSDTKEAWGTSAEQQRDTQVDRYRDEVESLKRKLESVETNLRQQLAVAEKTIQDKDLLVKMLEAENKHLSSLVEESDLNQHLKHVYESAPQKRTSKRTARRNPLQHETKMLRSLNGSNIAPITIRMPDNARLGWSVTKSGIVMHRIMIEFSATLDQLHGRKMMLKWSILRRFSAFEKLYEELMIAGFTELPSLPAKSWFRVDPRKRQQELYTFLSKLLGVPGVMGTHSFRKFLNLTEEMAMLLPGGSNRPGMKKRGRER
ncbi:hypothetical protein AAMO2058_000429700 [Amorphochlora amoebiformis]